MLERGYVIRMAKPIGRTVPLREDGHLRINTWLKGDNNRPGREWILSTAWSVEQNTPVAPLAFMHWFKLKPSPDTFIDKVIRDTCLLEKHRHRMSGAIANLLVEIAFPEIAEQWKDLAKHLANLTSVGGKLLELTSANMSTGRKYVVLPPDIAVQASTEANAEVGPVQKELKETLATMIEYWESELEAIKPWVSKRGQKGDPALRHFASIIVEMAGDKLALPSNEAKEGKRAAYDTPLLKLMRESLRAAIEYGDKVLERSSLDKVRKKKARAALASLKTKSDGALIDQLRMAKKTVAAR